MKLTKMVVDNHMNLIGFIVKGKGREFGEMINGEVERTMAISAMSRNGFTNNQVKISKGCITELGSFKLSDLGMVMYDGATGNTMDIDNTITLDSRYVMNNENIGFGVTFGDGRKNKYKYEDIIKLSDMFKPVNFVIRYNNSGKRFIAGKTGCPLSSLPEVTVGERSEAKRVKPTTADTTPITGTMSNTVDIFDLLEFVSGVNGFIINMPGNKYTATGDTLEKADDSFTAFNVGEIASPKLDFNETKFNASCKFRNPGYIREPGALGVIPGIPGGLLASNIYTYIWRSKNVFYNGECHMTKLGIIIPASAEAQLFNSFARSMSVTPITNTETIKIVNQLINWPDSKIYEVDISKLSLLSPSKLAGYIMDNKTLKNTVEKVAINKIIQKYCRGVVKDAKEAGAKVTRNSGLAPICTGVSQERLDKLVALGINPYDGSYNAKGETVENVKSGSLAAPQQEVNYVIDGMNPANFNYKKMVDKPETVPASVSAVLAGIDFTTAQTALDSASEIQKKAETAEWVSKRALWLHRTSMWLQSGKTMVHKGDLNWKINEKSRMKGLTYTCTEAGAEGLNLVVNNISAVK